MGYGQKYNCFEKWRKLQMVVVVVAKKRLGLRSKSCEDKGWKVWWAMQCILAVTEGKV